MPYGDRTGPKGMGPRTGRGFGFCNGYGMPGYASGRAGMGFRRGFGRGYGREYRAWPGGYGAWSEGPYYSNAPFPQKEDEWLANRAEALKEELKFIEKRIKDLDKKEEKK